MKYKKILLFSLLIISLLQVNMILFIRGSVGTLEIASTTYTTNTIYIDNINPSMDWNYTKHTYDWCSGSGTIVDPYIIEDVTVTSNLSGTPCLIIANSDVYFIIRNNIFTNSTDGFGGSVYFDNVANGHFIENQIVDNEAGMFLDDCFEVTISDNLFNNNTAVGLVVAESESITVRNNEITKAQIGIAIGLSEYITISNNEIYECDGGLTYFIGFKYTAIGNNIHDNSLGGFAMMGSEFCEFSGNILDNNNMSIYLMTENYKNIFTENTIQNSEEFGVFIEDSLNSDNLFYKNYFYLNNISAFDNGTLNYWDNGEIGNFWDDYDGVDADRDGIGDTPYNITGSANSVDNYPIVPLEEKAEAPPMLFYWIALGFLAIIIIAVVVIAKSRSV